MKEVVTIVSGGSMEGKTTLAINLAILMAQKGYKVALMDFDREYPAAMSIGQIDDIPLTVKNVLEGFAEAEDVFYSGISGVEVIPVGMDIKELRRARMSDLLERVVDSADIVFLDIPGGFDEETVVAISASSSVLAVLQPLKASLQGAIYILPAVQKLKADFAGVVVNNRGEMGEVEVEDIRTLFGNVLGEIPNDEAVRKSMKSGRPLVFSSPMSEASGAIKQLADAFNDWIKSLGEGERRELAARRRFLKTLSP